MYIAEKDWILEKDGPLMDFFTASILGIREVVRYHMSRGQDINQRNIGGWTALMYACASHRDDLVSYFLNVGADISAVDQQGKNFLTVAAENGNIKAIRLLRNWMNVIQEDLAEADRYESVKSIINLAEEKYGFTPLMFAAWQSSNEMVTLLLSMGADNRLRDRSGRTASELAASSGDQKTSWLLKFYDNFTVRDVLEDAGVSKYYELFAEVSVDALLTFDEGKLKILGLNLLGPRKKLLMTIEKLKTLRMKRYDVLSFDKEQDHNANPPSSGWNERIVSPTTYKPRRCTSANTRVACANNFFSLST